MDPRQYIVDRQAQDPDRNDSRMFRSSNGVEIFRMIDTLVVKHLPSVKEVVLGIASQAKYNIFNGQNEQILTAFEESGLCQRIWCPTARRFTLHILDHHRQEIIRVHREFKCCSGCCWCAHCESCRQVATVESPPGNIIGTITQEGSCWRMHYVLKDAHDQTVLTILGPNCICDGPLSCCCANKFTIFGTDGSTEIGAIHKEYAGYCAEAYTSADTFSYQVPMNLDAKIKAIVLAALFVIDFTNFGMVPSRSN